VLYFDAASGPPRPNLQSRRPSIAAHCWVSLRRASRSPHRWRRYLHVALRGRPHDLLRRCDGSL